MSAEDLHRLYKNLNESFTELPADEVNESAKQLLTAPENKFLTKQTRLEAIVRHSNYSREVYDLLLSSYEPGVLTSKGTNVLHMLLTNPNTTLADVKTLHDYAEQTENIEWFNNVVEVTINLNEYQLKLTYNGASLVQERTLREQLIRTIMLLQGFQQAA